jgi:hypothetical protein
MTEQWKIETTNERGALPVGPFPADTLPERYDAEASADGLQVRCKIRFDGERLAVEEVHVTRTDGGPVRPRELSRIQLGEIVRGSAEALGTAQESAHVGHRPGRRPTDEELALVAAVYCWNHATWGKPRQAVMRHWDLPSATASYWINKAREVYRFPSRDEQEA